MISYTTFISARVWVLIVFVGLLSSSQMMLFLTASELKSFGHVINLAGRQRLLSQRVMYFTCASVESGERAESESQLLSAMEELYEGHNVLLLGSNQQGIPVPDETFEAELLGLSGYVSELRDLVFEQIDEKKDNSRKIELIIDSFLPRMNLAVGHLSDRLESKISFQNITNLVSDFLIFFVGIIMYRNYRIKRRKKKKRRINRNQFGYIDLVSSKD